MAGMGTPVRTVPSNDVYETESGWYAHGIFVPWSVLHSPDGDPWPVLLYPRLRTLLNEYGWICRLARTTFSVYGGFRSSLYQDTFHPVGATLHPHGYALDILPDHPDWTPSRMAVYAKQRWGMPHSRLTGIGITPYWLHIDIRPRRRRTIWRASSDRPE
jgi:hypothetical protein